MNTLHTCMILAVLAAGAPIGFWRPWRRSSLPGRRAAGLLIVANLLLLYGIASYLAWAGYVDLWLSQWRGGGS